MNEKLREIAIKAQVEHCVSHVRLQEFAELIVRECQSRVEQYISDCGEIGSLPDTVIKKHFGVEE